MIRNRFLALLILTATIGLSLSTCSSPLSREVTGIAHLEERTQHGGIEVWVDGTVRTTTRDDGAWQIVISDLNRHQIELKALGFLTAITVLEATDESVSAYDTDMIMLGAGDVNGDGIIDNRDLAMIGATYKISPPSPPWADLNNDRVVDDADLKLVQRNFDRQSPILLLQKRLVLTSPAGAALQRIIAALLVIIPLCCLMGLGGSVFGGFVYKHRLNRQLETVMAADPRTKMAQWRQQVSRLEGALHDLPIEDRKRRELINDLHSVSERERDMLALPDS